MSADSFLQKIWYERAPSAPCLLVSWCLLPLSWLFAALLLLRRTAYRTGWLRTHAVSRPVIIVGNVTVGGTGKTPLVIWLADLLRARGRRVGIINRGYGGRGVHWPRRVAHDTPTSEVGDEAVLLSRRTQAIVVSGPDRVAAARYAIEQGADVVLCDDGLQHYRLRRQCEIAVLDEKRGLGNGRLLPAGPLRESSRRLGAVDAVVLTRRTSLPEDCPRAPAIHGWHRRSPGDPRYIVAQVKLLDAVSLATGARRALATFAGTQVHGIAAIGHPEAFFAALRELGIRVDGRALPDHAALRREDIVFGDDAPVLMTEKDAVKCRAYADERHWMVLMDLDIGADDRVLLSTIVERVLGESQTGQGSC